jgi:hypothetical protein
MSDRSDLPQLPSTASEYVAEPPDAAAALERARSFQRSWAEGRAERALEATRAIELNTDPQPAQTDKFPPAQASAFGSIDLAALARAYGLDAGGADAEIDRVLAESRLVLAEREEGLRKLARLLPHTRKLTGLPAEWRSVHEGLGRPAIVVASFFAMAGGLDLPREGIALWVEALRLAVEQARLILARLPAGAEMTRRAGRAILDAVAPATTVLRRTLFYSTDHSFGVEIAQEQAAAARQELAALNHLDAAPLLDELFAAVAFDARLPDELSDAEPAKPFGAFLESAALAKYLGVPDQENAVDLALRQFAKDHPGCRECVETPRRAEPRILYRVDMVWPMLLAKLRGWRASRATTD